MTALAAIDPLHLEQPGRYADALVVVEVAPGDGGPAGGGLIASWTDGGRVLVRHDPLRYGPLDDGLAERLAAVLDPLTDDAEIFVRAFTGIVATSAGEPAASWEAFYRNSIAGIVDESSAGYAGVYRRAIELLPRSRVLDLGCGFGFLSLRLATLGADVVACDVDRGTVRLLRRMADRLRARVSVLDTDGARVPLPSASVDAVVMLHVLEHVAHDEGVALLAEATRLASRRVVVAVPYEDRPTRLYGHVRRLRPDDLAELGAATGWRYRVHEHLGGWLVLDRPSPGDRDRPPGRSPSPEGDLQ